MTKDYFQDITPLPEDEPRADSAMQDEAPSVPEKSIRNLNVQRKSVADRREAAPVGSGLTIRRVGISPFLLWGCVAAALCIAGMGTFFLFRPTMVTLVPRTYTIVFDQQSILTASPVVAAATGTIGYTETSFDIEDATLVAGQGLVHAEHKASGSVTVYNEYSTQPVRLIENTRFETSEGIVFRTPAEIRVPGMKGSVPGSVTVTLLADKPGATYNVPPVSKFTLPGLKGGAMYSKVYARSTEPFKGGFAGNEPQIAQATKDAAISEVRSRLEKKIQERLASSTEAGLVFPGFAETRFSEPSYVAESDSQVRLSLVAHVVAPVLTRTAFIQQVAPSIIADVQNAEIRIVPGEGFAVTRIDGADAKSNSEILRFTVGGSANVVWDINTAAVSGALAGKAKSEFEAVVKAFPSIAEAHARVEPFWSSHFPSSAGAITIIVEPAKPLQ